jgi:hypothetical protein
VLGGWEKNLQMSPNRALSQKCFPAT